MSFQTSLELNSPLFSAAKRKAAGGRGARNAARKFKADVQSKMENSPHTGRTVTKARGGNFRVRHQQSRRGERPAPFTRTLLNSVRDKRVSDTQSIVEIGADYAEKLIKLGRVLVSKPDVAEGQKGLNIEIEKEFSKLV